MEEKTIIEKLPLIKEKAGAPVYLFDSDALKERVATINNKIRARLGDDFQLCFAVKANPFLVRQLVNTKIKFEACSRGELELCLSENVPPKKIVMSGVLKTFDDIKRALEVGVGVITIESLMHAKLLLDALKKTDGVATVILRLSSGNQFGMGEKDFCECLLNLRACEKVKVAGVHYFSGTQKKDDKIKSEILFLKEFAAKHNLSLIEYGPGAFFDYYGAINKEADNKSPLEEITTVDTPQKNNINENKKIFWTIELGRYIAAPTGYYITEIMDKKENYLITDGGINHVNYFGQMMGMKVPRIIHIKNTKNIKNDKPGEKSKWTVSGSLCTTADVLVRALELDTPAIGDYLIFCDIGAYSITESAYLFLSHMLPAVYEVSDGEINERRAPIDSWRNNH